MQSVEIIVEELAQQNARDATLTHKLESIHEDVKSLRAQQRRALETPSQLCLWMILR